MKILLRALFALLMAGTVVWAFMVPPVEKFNEPDLARIIFFHLPCALTGTLFLILGSIFSQRYLKSRDPIWDVRAASSLELSFVLGLITLATGMIFARVQWLTWWEWKEVRMTSYLLVVLILGAYLALRSAYSEDPETQRRVSAVYVMAALLPVIFLVFVAPRLPMFQSLHPDVARDGLFDGNYRTVFLSIWTLILVASTWIYRLAVRAGMLELALEKRDAELADRDRPAATGVVRPVSLPREGR